MKKHNHSSGFTLVELLVVISIIAVLVSIVLGYISDARTKARNTALISEVHEQQNTLGLFLTDHDGYPPIPGGSSVANIACLTVGCEFAGQTPASLVSLNKTPTEVAKIPASSLAATAVLATYSKGDTSITDTIAIAGQDYKGLMYYCDQDNGTICTGLARIYYPVRGTYNGACGNGHTEANDGVNSLCYQSPNEQGAGSSNTSTSTSPFTYDSANYPYYSTSDISGYVSGTGWYNNGDSGWYGASSPSSPYTNDGGYGTCLSVYYYNGGSPELHSYCDDINSTFDGSSYPYFSNSSFTDSSSGDGWNGSGYYAASAPSPYTNQGGYGNCLTLTYYNGGSPYDQNWCDDSGTYYDTSYPYYESSDTTGSFSSGNGWNGNGYYANSIPAPYYYENSGAGSSINVYFYNSGSPYSTSFYTSPSWTYDSGSYPYYSLNSISDYNFTNTYGSGWHNNGDSGYYSSSAPNGNHPYINGFGNCVTDTYYNSGSPYDETWCDSNNYF